MSAVLFPAPLLSVERLSIQFGTQRVVDDVSFALWPGKTLCIAGESGSGKSLTSLAIMGLLPEEAQIPGGAIIFDNQANAVAARQVGCHDFSGTDDLAQSADDGGPAAGRDAATPRSAGPP